MTQGDSDVIVVGGGLAGLTAAIATAAGGTGVTLVARTMPHPDHRTSALMVGSVTALETLGVWPHCAGEAAPLRAIRIVDDTGRLLHAPEILFRSEDIGLEAFGYNIGNAALSAALHTVASRLPNLRMVAADVAGVEPAADTITVHLDSGDRLTGRLVIGADGRQSLCREAAGIAVREHGYPQAALALTLHHRRPHHGVSTEFHTPQGPFTLVPLPGDRSSVVWVTDLGSADRLAGLDDAVLAEEIEARAHSCLGRVTVEPGRGAFPLAFQAARAFAARRIALVGEAAHLIPPIGAQGLNLGLRDAATIAECVADAERRGEDIGGAATLERYGAQRMRDVTARAAAVDWLNRSLLSDLLPAQALRSLGLGLLGRIGPLRRAVMREGVMPAAGGQPRLMRGEAV